MIKIEDSALYKSLKASGASFGNAARKFMGSKGTYDDEFVTIENGDIVIFPAKLTYGYTKQYGSFVLAHILKGGKVENADIVQIYPRRIKHTCWPVEDNDGVWERTGETPKSWGQVIEHIKSYGNYGDAFDAMAGRAISISNGVKYTVLRFGTKDETRDDWVYQIDFVDVAPEWVEFTEQEITPQDPNAAKGKK